MRRESGPRKGTAPETPAKDQTKGYLRLVEPGEDRPTRAQLAVMPDGPPDIFGEVPAPPPNTGTEWLVSWCWPGRPDEVRRKVFHTREKAEAMRARLERGFNPETPAEVLRTGELVVRIDARQCSSWVEVA